MLTSSSSTLHQQTASNSAFSQGQYQCRTDYQQPQLRLFLWHSSRRSCLTSPSNGDFSSRPWRYTQMRRGELCRRVWHPGTPREGGLVSLWWTKSGWEQTIFILLPFLFCFLHNYFMDWFITSSFTIFSLYFLSSTPLKNCQVWQLSVTT